MTAYLIVFAKIHNRERLLSDYGAPTAALVKEFGGEYVIRAPGVKTLEGDMFDGASAVISKWPDRETLEQFWNCEAYTRLKEVRASLADCNVMMVEVPPS